MSDIQPGGFTENYALLTGGPSLEHSWNDGMCSLFNAVYAVNLVGARFAHHYCVYLDTPKRIFGDPYRKQWPKTMRGFIDRQTPPPIDPECGKTFPFAFRYLMKCTRASARIFIFGWDCAGTGVVDGAEWAPNRDDQERALMRKYWNPEKVAGVSGKMREWAETELGCRAIPIGAPSPWLPPPRNREEAAAFARGDLIG